MDKKTLEKIKEGLSVRKQQIEKELKAYTAGDNRIIDTKFPQFGDKDDENANEVATYSNNLSVEHSLQRTLDDINKALERIEQETYGICRYCNKPIDKKRLLARPVSSACINCKNRLSKS